MTERIQKTKEHVEQEQAPVEEIDERKIEAARAAGEAVMNELDDLLDEIDGVLETNAEEFVNSYIQKGGE